MNQPLPALPPGQRWINVGGRYVAVVDVPSGAEYQRVHALGQPPNTRQSHPTEAPVPRPMRKESEDYPGFVEIPAFYTVSIVLGGADDSVKAGSTNIRPEPFVCRRITWATTGDAPKFITTPSIVGSAQGRVVRVTWEDEFTKFLGNQPCLISALFGDSEGFLDFPRRGVLFQGKQTLSVNLHRLFWPDLESTPADTEFDFNFQGVGLLPMDINQSGSAG